MSLEVKDVAGVSQPVTKLIEVVSAGIGTLYRPRAIRAEADARAYELKAVAKAEAEAEVAKAEIHRQYTVERIIAVARENPHLAERAKQRLLAREIEGQINVEQIAEHALLALPQSVSNEPLGENWRRKFFQEAENICEGDMQALWGKVLAGEIASPGAFSLRALETLRQLSREEAELFRCICGLSMSDGWIAIPGHDLNTALKPFGITYGNILTLRDAGLIMDGDKIHKDFQPEQPLENPEKYQVVLVNNGLLISLSGQALGALRLPALLLTQAGRELQRLIEPVLHEAYLSALGASIRQRGVVVKRGTPIPQSETTSVLSFEQDL